MRNALIIPIVILLQTANLAARPAPLQAYDPLHAATGWAHADKDGSCTFYNPAARTLDTWMKDLGVTGSLDLSKLEVAPGKWVLDPYGNAWIVSGPMLYKVDKNGKPGTTVKLPGEVTDLAWDTKGFVLLFKGAELYLEKRDYVKASVIWSTGKKPKNGDGTPAEASSQRLAIAEDGNVLVANGESLSLQYFDGAKGSSLGDIAFSLRGGTPPRLALGDKERGAMAWWLGHGVAFAAIPGSQVPGEKKAGLLLARMDLAAGTLEFLPTGVSEDHRLVGVLDAEALLEKPGGGLVLVPVK